MFSQPQSEMNDRVYILVIRMNTDPFNLTIHMVSSLDGIIAKPDNSVSWFEVTDNFENGVTGEEGEEVLKSIDCYVMGANTYEHALELSKTYGWAYGQTPAIVVTHRNLPVYGPTVEMYSGELSKLVSERLKPRYKNVWLVGGAMLSREFIRLGLVNDIRLSILPIILGEGLSFLNQVGKEQVLHVKNVTAYKNGMIELWYGMGKRK